MNELELSYHTANPDANIVTCADFQTGLVSCSSSGLVERFKTDRKPKTKSAQVTIFADMINVRIPELAGERPPGRGGIKQPITEFTRNSRRAMLNAMAQMRNVGTGYFIHLTFPGMIHFPARFIVTKTSAKNALAALRKRIAREFPGSGGIWRMELKRRKSGASMGRIVPHFHIMLFGLPDDLKKKQFREWIAQAWNDIIDPLDEDHFKSSTRTDLIVNRRHAMSYASKYTAKTGDDTDEDGQLWGRRWGTFGNVDRSPVIIINTTPEMLVNVRREIRKFLHARNKCAWNFAWNNTKTVGIVPVKPRRSKYAERLSRLAIDDGFSILGLGDLSHEDWKKPMDITAWKMIALPLSVLCNE